MGAPLPKAEGSTSSRLLVLLKLRSARSLAWKAASSHSSSSFPTRCVLFALLACCVCLSVYSPRTATKSMISHALSVAVLDYKGLPAAITNLIQHATFVFHCLYELRVVRVQVINAVTDNAAVLQQRVTKGSNVFLASLAEPGEAQFLTVLKPCSILLPHTHQRANEFYSILFGAFCVCSCACLVRLRTKPCSGNTLRRVAMNTSAYAA